MEIEKKLALIQHIYAASVAESVNNYKKFNVLDEIVERKKGHQAQAASMLNQMFGIQKVEDVFMVLAEVFGCANWSVEKTADGYLAFASACKLCGLSKSMGGANPCQGWCLDPMIAMIAAIPNANIQSEQILVNSTLMDSSSCSIQITVS